MKQIRVILLLSLAIFIGSCSQPDKQNKPAAIPSTIYFGGDIITMEGDSAVYAETVVEREGKILFVGTKEEAIKTAGEGHQMVDLKGQLCYPASLTHTATCGCLAYRLWQQTCCLHPMDRGMILLH